jgi:hypothetical protein
MRFLTQINSPYTFTTGSPDLMQMVCRATRVTQNTLEACVWACAAAAILEMVLTLNHSPSQVRLRSCGHTCAHVLTKRQQSRSLISQPLLKIPPPCLLWEETILLVLTLEQRSWETLEPRSQACGRGEPGSLIKSGPELPQVHSRASPSGTGRLPRPVDRLNGIVRIFLSDLKGRMCGKEDLTGG